MALPGVPAAGQCFFSDTVLPSDTVLHEIRYRLFGAISLAPHSCVRAVCWGLGISVGRLLSRAQDVAQ